jgi:protease II
VDPHQRRSREFPHRHRRPEAAREWSELIPGSDRTYLRGITSHRDHLLIGARVDGLDQLMLRDYATGAGARAVRRGEL